MTRPARITDPDSWHEPAEWSEDDLAMAVTTRLRRLEQELPFTFAHDQNGARRSKNAGARARAMGMRAGEPDVRVYRPHGLIGHIELKTEDGALSNAQQQRHEALQTLGHDVRLVAAGTPGEAADKVETIVREWIGE